MRLLELSSSTHSLFALFIKAHPLNDWKKAQKSIFINLSREKSMLYVFAVVFVLFLLHKPLLPPPLRTASAGGQGTAHVNSKAQQCLWWLQGHIPGIILQERNSDWVQKEISFLPRVWTCSPAVTVQCTERVGAGILHPKLAEFTGAWLGNSAPSCRKEGTEKFLWFYSPRAAVAAVSGLGRRLEKPAWTETLRGTSRDLQWVPGHRALTWQPGTAEGKLWEVLWCGHRVTHTPSIITAPQPAPSPTKCCQAPKTKLVFHQFFHTKTTCLHALPHYLWVTSHWHSWFSTWGP